MGSGPRRFELRARTAAGHAALEGVIGALTSLPVYKSYLKGLHAGRAPVEASLERLAWPAAFEGWRPSLIAGALSADLADLDLMPLPHGPLDAPRDVSDLLGLLYVLEGSSLGARLVYRQAQALGLNEGFGARHLALQVGSPNRWRGFLEILDSAADYNGERAAAAATAAFTIMRQAMTEGAACHV